MFSSGPTASCRHGCFNFILFNIGFCFNVTDIDMLENVEIGEQKQRDEAYKAAKKKTGVYVDKYVNHNYKT